MTYSLHYLPFYDIPTPSEALRGIACHPYPPHARSVSLSFFFVRRATMLRQKGHSRNVGGLPPDFSYVELPNVLFVHTCIIIRLPTFPYINP